MNNIRRMADVDKNEVLSMMSTFYASPAVLSNGSDEIFARDFESCVGECPYVEGYIFHDGEELQGYAMVAKSFSTEFGKPCVWIEDLYVKEQYRGRAVGREFLKYIKSKYPDCIFRLEAEKENEKAVSLYKRQGYKILPYMEMINIKSNKSV